MCFVIDMAPNSTIDSLPVDLLESRSRETDEENCAQEIGVDSECLTRGSDKSFSPVADYFAIALAVAAIGSLLRTKSKGAFQAACTARTLKGGLELANLSHKALALEDVFGVQTVPTAEILDALRLEKMQLEEKIANAVSEVEELKKRRTEDAKGNEKVVNIFASYEQEWKKERKKLMNEVDKLRHELQQVQKEKIQQRMQITTVVQEKDGCEECSRKECQILNLKERLGEQDFLILASMEEVKAEQEERKELARKLTISEDVINDLNVKLMMEVNERTLELQKHESVLLDLRCKQREAEKERSLLVKEFGSFERERHISLEEKKCADELIERLSIELSKLREDSDQKEMIISAMLWKGNACFQEKHDFGRKPVVPTEKCKLSESSKQKFQKSIEEYTCSTDETETSNFNSREETCIDRILAMQRLHDAEVKKLQSVLGLEVNMLRDRVRIYQDRVAELEKRILLCMPNTKHVLRCGEEHFLRVSESNETMTLEESVTSNGSSRHIQLLADKGLLAHYMDIDKRREEEVCKWKKLYFSAKAIARMLQKEKETAVCTSKNLHLQNWAQFTRLLEQRHCYEIDAFERQMKAKDERMEAFRWQLLRLEKDAFDRLEKVEALTKELQLLEDEKLKIQRLSKEQEIEIAAYREQLMYYPKHKTGVCAYEINKENTYEVEALHKEIDSIKKLIRDKELEHELTLKKVVEEAHVELQDKDFKLAMVEAKLVQAQLHYEKDKKIRENSSSHLLPKRVSLDHFARDNLLGKPKLTDELGAVCHKVQKLSNRILESQEKILEIEHQQPEKPHANAVMPGLDEKCQKYLSYNIEGDSASVVKHMHKQRSELLRWDMENRSREKEVGIGKFVDATDCDSCQPFHLNHKKSHKR